LDMGIYSGLFAYSYLMGAHDLPKRVPTGYFVVTKDNIKDPQTLKWLYKQEVRNVKAAEKTSKGKSVKVAYVPGMVHTFYNSIQWGLEYVAGALGFEVVTQIPDTWDAALQTQIIDSLLARGDIDFFVVVPTDKDALVEPLKRIANAGIPVITVDTFIGDGNYEKGHPVTFPVSYIGSDNTEGGRIAGEALVKAIGGKGKVYVQNVLPGISTTDQRFEGFMQVVDKYPNIKFVGIDYNETDSSKAANQTAAKLQSDSDIAAIFGCQSNSAQGAGLGVQNAGLTGKVKVMGYDFDAIDKENIEKGIYDMTVAQKPSNMGIYSGMFAYVYLMGAHDLPKRVPTGYFVVTKDNIKDPQTLKWLYKQEL
jgi:ribose transport system substrate-binding protein